MANANTPGYVRETPTWKENTPVTINGLAFGTGVTQTGAQSLRDRVLLERLNQQQELSSASSARLDALNNMQALFLRYDGIAGTWASVTSVVTASFSGGVCSASTNATWDPSSISDYGVRVRDSRFAVGGSQCTNPGTEVTATTPRAACIGATSTVGSASCGFAVDPSFISSTTCDNF